MPVHLDAHAQPQETATLRRMLVMMCPTYVWHQHVKQDRVDVNALLETDVQLDSSVSRNVAYN